jgi:hypothetical protein
MKKFFIWGSLVCGLFCVAQPAQALIEAKVTYGLLNSNPDLSQLYSGGTSLPSVTPTYGLGADLILNLPLVPIGFGLRYEDMGLKASSGGLTFDAKYTRTALILNYRLIDTILHLGPIFTYGLSHSTRLTAIENGTTKSDFSSASVTSYSIGLEVGVQVLSFLVGAEAGYEDFRWKSAHDNSGNFSDRDINMSGSYAKLMIGLGI